jgi:hypothetical protein
VIVLGLDAKTHLRKAALTGRVPLIGLAALAATNRRALIGLAARLQPWQSLSGAFSWPPERSFSANVAPGQCMYPSHLKSPAEAGLFLTGNTRLLNRQSLLRRYRRTSQ